MSQNFLREHWGLPPIPEGLLVIGSADLSQVGIKIPLFSKHNCKIYWTIRGRRIEYQNGSIVLMNKKAGIWNFLIDARSEPQFLELGKLIYLSVFGIQQEQSGCLRIHSALVQKRGRHRLFWGPPNAGKTTLARHFYNQNPASVLTDELTLFDGLRTFGIPLKMHNKSEMHLIDIHQKTNAAGVPRFLYLIERQSGRSFMVQNLNASEKLFLIFHFLIGTGLHQMAEYHLTLAHLPVWLKILRLRVVRTWQLFKVVKIRKLKVPPLKI